MKALTIALRVSLGRAKQYHVSTFKTITSFVSECCAGLLAIIFMKRGLAGVYIYQWVRQIDDIVDGEVRIDEPVENFLNKKLQVFDAAVHGTYNGIDEYDELLFAVCRKYKDLPELITGVHEFLETFQFEILLRKVNSTTLPRQKDLDVLAQKWEFASFAYACKIADIRFAAFASKAPEYFGLLQKIDWLVDIIEDMEAGYYYISSEDSEDMGVPLIRLKSNVKMGVIVNNFNFISWRHGKAIDLLEQLNDMKKKLGSNPFDSWVLNNVFYRLIIPRWEVDLVRLAERV